MLPLPMRLARRKHKAKRKQSLPRKQKIRSKRGGFKPVGLKRVGLKRGRSWLTSVRKRKKRSGVKKSWRPKKAWLRLPKRRKSSKAKLHERVRLPRWRRGILREDLNFLLTNRIPRRLATRFMGWYSKIENPLLCRASIAVWRRFSPDLDFEEAKSSRFRSLHDCFVRELQPGSRPVDADPSIVVSPCDAIVGAHGEVRGREVFQAKGFPYRLDELLADDELVERHEGSKFITLRLKSSFYHRFHAPCAGSIRRVRYMSGDTWNVNPIALQRVEKLFCKNERAVLDIESEVDSLNGAQSARITLVPVAAILVASIVIHGLPRPLNLRYRGPNDIPCELRFAKGQELGYFEHGSTIVLFASGDFEWDESIREGHVIRAGEALLRARTHAHAHKHTDTKNPRTSIDE